ncbi:MAG TPA: hypothetical protein PKG48_10905 [Bacteroidales bacterium]|nr:hypothetical protein [Bacteroidales bacterium]HPS61509.1 hypothetical protein [Bacteroidales bacterium]
MNKFFVFLSALIFLASTSDAQQERKPIEIQAGFGMLITQSVFSMQNGFAPELAVAKEFSESLAWQAGIRLGLNPVLPEAFGRLLVRQRVGAWQPAVGLELGTTRRTRFDAGKALLRETREAMQGTISPFYVAVHAAPLSFGIREKWRLSLLEIDFGTHFSHPGRTLRAQVMLVTLTRKF